MTEACTAIGNKMEKQGLHKDLTYPEHLVGMTTFTGNLIGRLQSVARSRGNFWVRCLGNNLEGLPSRDCIRPA